VIIFDKYGDGQPERSRATVAWQNWLTGGSVPGGETASGPVISDTNFQPLASFLTETGSHSEIDVTPTKQTTEEFLTGTRIDHLDSAAQQVQP
jgi:hypothetical protein